VRTAANRLERERRETLRTAANRLERETFGSGEAPFSRRFRAFR